MSIGSIGTKLQNLTGPHSGVLVLADLPTAGISVKTVRRLVSAGWLVPIRQGAYAVGGRKPSDWQQLVAAYRLAGPAAVVSHWSAARVHDLPVAAKDFGPELTMIDGRDIRLGGVRIHANALPPSQYQVKRGLRTTTAPRTLVDLAPRLGHRALELLIDEGVIARLWTVDSIKECLASRSRRPGLTAVRELLAYRDERSAPESSLEVRVIRALAAYRPFETQYHVIIDGQLSVLDVAWPELLVAVETDGWYVRSKSRAKFDRDRRKSNLLTAHGWTVLHLTSAMSDDEMRAAVFPVLVAAAAARGVVAPR